MTNAIGEIINTYRTDSSINLTLNNLAKKTGLSQPFLSMVENGKKKPSLETLFKIIDVLASNGKLNGEDDKFYSTIYFTQSIVNDLINELGFIDQVGKVHPNEKLEENEINILNGLVEYSENLSSVSPETPIKYLDSVLESQNSLDRPTNLNRFIKTLEYDIDFNFLLDETANYKLNMYLDGNPIKDEELDHLINTLCGIRYQRNK